MRRSSVVLPQPDGPSRAKNMPPSSVRETWSTTRRPPRLHDSPLRRRASALAEDFTVPGSAKTVPVAEVSIVGIITQGRELLFRARVDLFPERILGRHLLSDRQDSRRRSVSGEGKLHLFAED